MVTLTDLANGCGLIYIVTRLFDLYEKIKAEKVEKAVLAGLQNAMSERGIKPVLMNPMTFVPFRDTVQDKIEANNKTKIIYEEDIKRLKKLFGIVGFLDGLSKDEGVCMEIGYAYALSVPILIVLSDFIRREIKDAYGSEHLLDPVLQVMASKIIYEYKIPETEGPFIDRLNLGLNHIYKRIEEEVCDMALTADVRKPANIIELQPIEVYIDFGGGHFEWERIFQNKLSETLKFRGIPHQTSQRYISCMKLYNPQSSAVNLFNYGLKDISNAANAKVVVTCGDGDEMSSGTAAIQGFARALNKKIILYDSKVTCLVGNGGHKMSRNLMIDYSADIIVRKLSDLPDAIEKLL